MQDQKEWSPEDRKLVVTNFLRDRLLDLKSIEKTEAVLSTLQAAVCKFYEMVCDVRGGDPSVTLTRESNNRIFYRLSFKDMTSEDVCWRGDSQPSTW